MNKNLKIILAGAVAATFAVAGIAIAATGTIDATYHHAWNDVIGWMDFGNGTVTVTDTKLTGYTIDAPPGSQYGNIALDCATPPGGVAKCAANGGFDWWVGNDGAGNLMGWAWSDVIGWISFCGGASTANCPGAQVYQVKIDPASGVFSGWAWNDVVGWISFNCNNAGIGNQCPTSDYKVKTSWTTVSLPSGIFGGFDANTWLESSTFDTQIAGGAAFNTISWQGTLNAGRVGLQIAVSNNPAGPWTNADFHGPDGSSSSIYETAGPNAQLPIAQAAALRRNTNNNRYVRYMIWLGWTGASPQVDDVVISYSP